MTWMEQGTEPVLPDSGWAPVVVEEWQDPSQDATIVEVSCPNGWSRVHIDNFLLAHHRAGPAAKRYQVAKVRAELDNWINETSRTWREDRDW